MLLVFPPGAKPSEPPAGIAKLAGALRAHAIPCAVLDANIEGLLHLLRHPEAASDTWSRRAIKHVASNVAALRDPRTYQSRGRYGRTVRDINRVLEIAGRENDATVSLADYRHRSLSALRSADLLYAAEHPEQNPFYPWFRERLMQAIEDSRLARNRGGRGEHVGEQNLPAEPGPVIGFSLNYLSQALTTFAMIGFVRRMFPKAEIVLGGGLVTSWMKRPGADNPFADLVDSLIAGPGEGPLLDLLGAGDSVTHAAPDYGSLPLREYFSPGFILPYSASQGCSWSKCSFCPETAEKNPYSAVPVEKAMADLAALVANHRPVMLHLLDNAVSPALMRALAERPIGVPWYGFARIGKELTDVDYCVTLKRSGCAMLKLGLESGDQGVLDALGKGIDLETAARVLTNLRRAGIAAYVYLLFGTPAETAVEARKTLDFVVKHRDAISVLNLAIFNLPVCGKETLRYETMEFYEGNLSLYTGFRHPRGWDRPAVRQFLDGEFRSHPALAKILGNDPPVFTSNHAALFSSHAI